MTGPRRDTRGIVEARELFARVRFRRREPAPDLRPYLEHYWLIDWDLTEPYASNVVPHPSVNVVFQRYDDAPAHAEVAGIGLELFTHKLAGLGRVCGVQFRPGGFRPFAPDRPVSDWTGQRLPIGDVLLPGRDEETMRSAAHAVVDPDDENARVAALDTFLLGLDPRPDPRAEHAMELVERVRTDRSVRRVSQLAEAAGLSPRSLQRLFAGWVGVGPKWVILRYRIHEALERAEQADEQSGGPTGAAAGRPAGGVDWAALADDLGYSDQAHLVRDFTATVGVPPSAYTRAAR
ncbi:AraC family transcriptional regulator [Streptomyces sp. Tu 2975]|uniref:helix-turn-helix domain-containing protein n=1 Tax=Streptomyces sp. Tu 2975 TaxID=2676871 RepID=UPI001359B887|nr:helix-turn-helix domain-containing protein [Streptomyces sp. Tu 2975]QIP85271.1 AraC family transcriptional regulator [Streptomyces sp. Tu 2975]